MAARLKHIAIWIAIVGGILGGLISFRGLVNWIFSGLDARYVAYAAVEEGKLDDRCVPRREVSSQLEQIKVDLSSIRTKIDLVLEGSTLRVKGAQVEPSKRSSTKPSTSTLRP